MLIILNENYYVNKNSYRNFIHIKLFQELPSPFWTRIGKGFRKILENKNSSLDLPFSFLVKEKMKNPPSPPLLERGVGGI